MQLSTQAYAEKKKVHFRVFAVLYIIPDFHRGAWSTEIFELVCRDSLEWPRRCAKQQRFEPRFSKGFSDL